MNTENVKESRHEREGARSDVAGHSTNSILASGGVVRSAAPLRRTGMHPSIMEIRAVHGSDVVSRVGRLARRLRERKIAQWLAGYIAAAFVVLQVTDSLDGIWGWPSGVARAVTLALGLGTFPASVIAWYHGEKGRQQICATEVLVVATMSTAACAVIWCLCFRHG